MAWGGLGVLSACNDNLDESREDYLPQLSNGAGSALGLIFSTGRGRNLSQQSNTLSQRKKSSDDSLKR
jgi:hypothetical protein